MTLWGGRFSTKLNDQAWDLNSSLPVDQRMALQDADGSIAWASAIHKANILSDKLRTYYMQHMGRISTAAC